MPTRKLNLEGREVTGSDVGFQIVQDGAVTLELDDGAQLRLRPIVLNVVRTDEKADGERVYLVHSISQARLIRPAKEDES